MVRAKVITRTYTTYPDEYKALCDYADENNTTMSAVIRLAVRQFLARETNNVPGPSR